MGWLFRDEKLRHETPAEYFTREYTHDGEWVSNTVVAIAAVRGTIYAAIRTSNKHTGTSFVFCAVTLFKNSKRDGFGYKSMDESMGPYEVDCPDRIIRLLSRVEDIPIPATRHSGGPGSPRPKPQARAAEQS